MSLEPPEQDWLEAYKKALEREYPGVVQRIIVYGSKARGNAHEDSDIDIVMLMRDDAGRIEEDIRLLGHRLADFKPVLPSLFTFTEASWARRLADQYPFQQNVEREGMDVLGPKVRDANEVEPATTPTGRKGLKSPPAAARAGTGRPMNRKAILSEWRLSRNALKGSKTMIDVNLPEDSVSRSYYAMLHGARAALLTKGITTRSHAGVSRLLGRHLVVPGEIEPNWPRTLASSLEKRMEADYGAGEPMSLETAREHHRKAKAFTERIKQLLRARGFDEDDIEPQPDRTQGARGDEQGGEATSPSRPPRDARNRTGSP